MVGWLEGWTWVDRRMEGVHDACKNGWTDGGIVGWKDERNGTVSERMGGCMDVWIGGSMAGYMADECMDGWI